MEEKERKEEGKEIDPEELKKSVREGYAQIALERSSCCGPKSPQVSCCGGDTSEPKKVTEVSKKIGYCNDDIDAIPEGADLGLGCGNPVAIASLKEGEIVVDLGSGAGIDCFIAGVDMTHEMLAKARENATKGDFGNVEFRIGEIEHLPVADNSVDVVISNCVINLAPDKGQVFKDAFRILKPGGRLMISDIVLTRSLPEAILTSIESYVGCIAGAMLKNDYLDTLRSAGFKKIEILQATKVPVELYFDDPNVKTALNSLDLSEDLIKAHIKRPSFYTIA